MGRRARLTGWTTIGALGNVRLELPEPAFHRSVP